MISVYDYLENGVKTFENIPKACLELNLNIKNVQRNMYRDLKTKKRYLFFYGKIEYQLVIDKQPFLYECKNVKTKKVKFFNSLDDLKKYCNLFLNEDLPTYVYHKAITRENIVRKTFNINRKKIGIKLNK